MTEKEYKAAEEEIANLKRIHQIYLQHETLGGEERIEHLLDLMERIDELQRNIKNKNQ